MLFKNTIFFPKFLPKLLEVILFLSFLIPIINLYDSGLSSRWYMFILIRENSMGVSQQLNTKKTLYVYFGLLGQLQGLHKTDSS